MLQLTDVSFKAHHKFFYWSRILPFQFKVLQMTLASNLGNYQVISFLLFKVELRKSSLCPSCLTWWFGWRTDHFWQVFILKTCFPSALRCSEDSSTNISFWLSQSSSSWFRCKILYRLEALVEIQYFSNLTSRSSRARWVCSHLG